MSSKKKKKKKGARAPVADLPPWADDPFSQIILESERGCVLLCVAMLDEDLTGLLRMYFRCAGGAKVLSVAEWLLADDPQPPLGSLGVKIRLAYCLGLMDGNCYRVLKAMQGLRNSFAHLSQLVELDEDDRKTLLAAAPDWEMEVEQHLAQKDAWDRRIANSRTKNFSLAQKTFIAMTLTAHGALVHRKTLLEHGIQKVQVENPAEHA